MRSQFCTLLATALLSVSTATWAQHAPECQGTVVIGDCDTGVPALARDGMCLQGLIEDCVNTTRDQGELVSCITSLRDLVDSCDFGALVSCAAGLSEPRADCPRKTFSTLTDKTDLGYRINLCAANEAKAKAKAEREFSTAQTNYTQVCELLASNQGQQCGGECDKPKPPAQPKEKCQIVAKPGKNLKCDRIKKADPKCPGDEPDRFNCQVEEILCRCDCVVKEVPK